MAEQNPELSRFPASGNFLMFLEENLLPNQPCMFRESFTKDWRARQEWRKEDDTPNLEFLRDNFGGAMVPVADCSKVQFSTHPKLEMTLQEYVGCWRSSESKMLYLKDWHFTKDFPGYMAYTVPELFHSDWLNEVWSSRQDVSDNYQFVYMGPQGTWTPFHADVFRSYSWSANVCGCKEWLLYPPGEEEHLRDKFGHLPFDVTSRELQNEELYPNYHKSRGPIRVIQESGEIIFIPSGWHHQVRNLRDTISINHNWTNCCGIGYMWTHLQAELALVKHELEDCRSMEGWEDQCQIVLKASAGIDYWEFVQLLSLVALSRLHRLATILSPTAKLWQRFQPLQTLILDSLSNPAKTVTFLKSAADFETVCKSKDTFDLTFHKCLPTTLKVKEKIEQQKLIKLLPSFVQELFQQDYCSIEEDKVSLVLFTLFELCIVSDTLPNVVQLL